MSFKDCFSHKGNPTALSRDTKSTPYFRWALARSRDFAHVFLTYIIFPPRPSYDVARRKTDTSSRFIHISSFESRENPHGPLLWNHFRRQRSSAYPLYFFKELELAWLCAVHLDPKMSTHCIKCGQVFSCVIIEASDAIML